MEKYGYKNISSRQEFEKASKNDGKFENKPVDSKHLTNYDFIDWASQGNWGMPGQTRYFVRQFDDLRGAEEKVGKIVTGERKPKGYVAW